MTAGAGTPHPTRKHRPGRIIERPRLIRQLDAAEAPVILIVAPAGYGKTTLARQWVRTLRGVIWVAATPSHRDVVTFSEDVAAGIDALGGNASRFIGEYMRARSNPQRAAREIAVALAKRLEEAPVQWLVIDDYQELAESPEIEEMVAVLRERIRARLVVASRTRPVWATTREAMYGSVFELSTPELALTEAESVAVVGGRPDLRPLLAHARGWPAVVGLAAALNESAVRPEVPSMVHQYVGEELFKAADRQLQQQLLSLALLPDLSPQTLRVRFGELADDVVEQARELGFIDAELDLHPLLREFLLTKLADDPKSTPQVRDGIEIALQRGAWEQALDLVLRFQLIDLIEPVFEQAFKPLSRTGRLGTLSSFAERVRFISGFPPGVIDVIDADVALRDRQYELAVDLARRASERLPKRHPLSARANLVRGRALFFTGGYHDAEAAYGRAFESALDEPDETESIFGIAAVHLFAETGDASPQLALLAERRNLSPTLLVRSATAELSLRQFSGGLADPLPVDEAMHYLDRVEDPAIRTAFTYTSAHLFAQRAEYRRAEELVARLRFDVERFGLEFAQPFADWTSALINLGLRHFGDASRYLERVEAVGRATPSSEHALNGRFLRARLLLQTGDATGAAQILATPHEGSIFPSWTGELHAMRSFAHACLGDYVAAAAEAQTAASATRCVGVSLLASVSKAIQEAHESNQPPLALFGMAAETSTWDPVLTALRASRLLLKVTASEATLRPALEMLIQRSEDVSLARQARIRSRPLAGPAQVLSPREAEVLDLVAQGLRNREIAAALFVAESTIKVHVRHILEKLGVRTRAEAVAQFERSRTAT